MNKLLLLVAGLAITTALTAAERAGLAFQPIDFDQAAKTAATGQKLVFIDFYTTWCGPCKMLDQQTWTDPEVAKVVTDAAIPLRLDAEKEGKALAAKYKINAYPTLLLLKPDGTEVDRLVGFREPAVFLSEFKSALTGKSSLQRAREAVATTAVAATDGPVTRDNVEARHALARQLLQNGQFAEALTEYLWLFDEGMVQVPSYTGVRLSFLTSELGRLARQYPPARDALVQRRDAAWSRFTAENNRTAVSEFVALNASLGEDQRTLAAYDALAPDDPRRPLLGTRLFRDFVKAKRYGDAVEAHPYALRSMMLDRLPRVLAKMPETRRPMFQSVEIRNYAEDLEALAGSGDLEHARALTKSLLALDSSDETKTLLRDHLTRAGAPALADEIK